MSRKRIIAVAVSVLLLTGTSTAAHAASPEAYGDYSRMFSRSAGQYWSGGQAAGQWAWTPQSATETQISWGDPAAWPPSSHENFVRDGDWVLLDGWTGNGTYYTQRVTQELIGDATCANLRPIASNGGRQHYVQWSIPGQGYCLKAWGTITEQSSGKIVDFGHTQIWSPPHPCSNPYYTAQACIKQWESWWDNNGSPGQPITRKLEREAQLARGIGMAFTIQQWYPSAWHADLRWNWTW
jgi:hypothetical protein